MKVSRIHKVLAFDQKAYLAPYIQFNTEKRKQAHSAFEKDFFKLTSNALYGKMIENLHNRTNIRLISDPKIAQKCIRKPTFQQFEFINNDLAMIHLSKQKIEMN